MPLTVEQFTERLTESGILPDEQFREFFASLSQQSPARSNSEELARELVRQKRLTKFQAEQIYLGKGASLTLGNYVILDKLGQGGMGMVLKAEHKRMKRQVAIKVMSPAAVKTPDALKRFHREVEAAAKLTHPNIVAAHDADEVNKTHFLVMEYVEGSDLSALVKKNGPFNVEQAVRCIIQAARGLEYAHKRGVIHRDIKPANLLLDREGTVKILDMGLARIDDSVGGSSEGAGLTSTGTIMGTVDYMSPEQAMDTKHADARSDIYSLGCTLYYLLTGRSLFDGDTIMKKLMAHQNGAIPSLEQVRAESRELRAGQNAGNLDSQLASLNPVFKRMVAKKPEDRQRSMTEVIAELERCLASEAATMTIQRSSRVESGNELQQFLRDISGESPSQATNASPSSKTSASKSQTVVSGESSLEATMISSDGMVATDQQTLASATKSAPRESGGAAMVSGSRGRLIAAASVAVLILGFVVWWSASKKSPEKEPNGGSPIATDSGKKAAKIVPPPIAQAPFDAKQAHAHQEAWAKHLGTTVETTNSIGAKMVLIPPGEFLMGSTDEQIATALELLTRIQIGPELRKSLENAERPQHRVVLSQPFLIGATEVTLGQFKAFVAATGYQTEAERTIAVQKKEQSTYLAPGGNVQDDFPVTVVSWNDANAFCDWLSKKEQGTYRLPTEAEWEFVCRAGTTTQYVFGDNAEQLDAYAWYSRNAGGSIHSVGTKPPNPFGLYDLHGNAAEWCQDLYSETAYGTLPPANPVGLIDGGAKRVMRGGGFSTTPIQCRSAFRTPELANHTYRGKGFRIVREVNHSDVNQVPDSTLARAQKDGWIDLLPLIDPQRDMLQVPGRTGKNDWQMRDGELTYAGDDFGGRLLLPANIVGPNVEVEFDITRTAGASNVELHLPSDKGPIPVELSRDGTTVYAGWPRAAIGKFSTKLGQRITYLCQLSKRDQLDAIDVFADGAPIGHWEGQRDAIAKEPEVKYPHGSRCVLIVLPKTDWTIHRFRVRTSGGSVEPLRAKSQIEANHSAPSRAKTPFTSMQARTHQETWATYLKVPRETTNSIGGKMVLIPPGEFLMGSTDEQIEAVLQEFGRQKLINIETINKAIRSERPQHRVMISQPFRMGATEVTVGQFRKFAEAAGYRTEAERLPSDPAKPQRTWLNPGIPVTDDFPVGSITWNDATAFCEWLSQREGVTCRLPKEAEWEYACRAGTTTVFFNGDDPRRLDQIGWSNANSARKMNPVGLKLPNAFGLFDMHGNALEWCQDFFEEDGYAKAPLVDPTGPPSGFLRVLRGGAADGGPTYCRSAARKQERESYNYWMAGFRVVAEINLPAHQASSTSGGNARDPRNTSNQPWSDWLGPKLQRNEIGGNGWIREGDAFTTERDVSGIAVMPGDTRDGAVRLTYLLRDSNGIVINARDRKTDNTDASRELYVVQDHGNQLSIRLGRAGVDMVLTKKDVPASIARDAPRTLEFRVVGDTLTATLNGSVIATATDATIPTGNFALVALKGVLIQKVEYQSLDEPK